LTDGPRQSRAGRVGRPHGLDGSFYVESATDALASGAEVTIAGVDTVIERRAGTADRPLIRVRGIADRDAAAALAGADVLVAGGDLEPGEYLAEQLVGCEIPGLGAVRRVIPAPSCDVLEVGEAALLVPFVSDAIARVDTEARVIEVHHEFLGFDGPGEAPRK
jgi:16S rRNA processing protein RimM